MPKNFRQKTLKENLINQTLEGDLIITDPEETSPGTIIPVDVDEVDEVEATTGIITKEITLEITLEVITITPIGIIMKITRAMEIISKILLKDKTTPKIISEVTKIIEEMAEVEGNRRTQRQNYRLK